MTWPQKLHVHALASAWGARQALRQPFATAGAAPDSAPRNCTGARAANSLRPALPQALAQLPRRSNPDSLNATYK